jgi:Carboxypeptidase regulatory-like domain/TonB-dependent Receptor Plug Domain
MRSAIATLGMLLSISIFLLCATEACAQNAGNSTSVNGTVTDPSGAVIPGATVTIHNPVSQLERTTTTDATGNFTIPNIPFNPYHMTVAAKGFASYVQDVEVRSKVPIQLQIKLALGAATSTVTVEAAGDLLETDSTAHTDVDRQLIQRLPLESQSSSISSLVTLASPGVAADSNGLFHGLGDHAENSFSVDGQPITDQQSKVFSNQIPVDSVQSLEVIQGAPPAEYGGKTSLVIDVTTRSGQGMTTPHGDVTASYGTFGTVNGGFNFGYGGEKWGNFASANGLNTGRFLDPPEFTVFHDHGNEENAFDRFDLQLSKVDAVHLNLGFSRSWFQTPNSYDAQNATAWYGSEFGNTVMAVSDNGIGPNGLPVGRTDQRSQILTYNIAPTWTRLIGSTMVFTGGLYYRHDQYNYYPSDNPFADLGAPSLQRQTVSQLRFLTNFGARASLSYVKGINNFKGGVVYQQTPLTEHDRLGIVDPTYNAPCITFNPTLVDVNTGIPGSYQSVQGFTDPSQCASAPATGVCAPDGCQPNDSSNPNAPNSAQFPLYNPVLVPYDLTRSCALLPTPPTPCVPGVGLYPFLEHTDIKEFAVYVQDTITLRNWSFNLGLRGDVYNGLTSAGSAEPRIGLAYNVTKTNTVLRASYARTQESPFNENLILSSLGCSSPVLNPLLLCSSSALTPLSPGLRNEFHVGLQQAFGKHVVWDGEYIWKYTHNGYDFSVLGNTPITFPIEWHNSKIPGFTTRINVTNLHGVTAYVVMSSVAAVFYTPQVAGAGAVPVVSVPGEFTPFRIDHDERFNQTTHLQYQPWRNGPWLGFNWRYDSGLVAGAVPCYGILPSNTCPGSVTIGGLPNVSMVASNVGSIPLSADQEFEAGFTCNGVHATPTTPLPFNCPASIFSSTLTTVPGPNKEQDDTNPPRIQPRNLFDLAVGDDNLFKGDRYKFSARVTVINLANKYALYNFLSTFSGTHYVTPRTVTGEIGFHF